MSHFSGLHFLRFHLFPSWQSYFLLLLSFRRNLQIPFLHSGLRDEYQREVAAHPDRHYKKPDNYSMSSPLFQWKDTQKTFFDNWLKQVEKSKLVLN